MWWWLYIKTPRFVLDLLPSLLAHQPSGERDRERGEMGNCQAIDAATLVIQHPCGKADTMYWPVRANEVMKMNPGHYVALLITSTLYPSPANENHPPNITSTAAVAANKNNNSVRITRIKLLRPTDTLVLGQVYRLITTQEVMKSLWAKKHAKMKKNQSESSAGKSERMGSRAETVPRRSEPERPNQVTKHEQQRQRTISTNPAVARSKTWQPSLHSISEATN